MLASVGGAFSLFVLVLVARGDQISESWSRAQLHFNRAVYYFVGALAVAVIAWMMIGGADLGVEDIREMIGFSLFVYAPAMFMFGFHLVFLLMASVNGPTKLDVSGQVKDRLKERRSTRHR